MLNRRHIRVKVMQALYALHQSEQPDLLKEEKFLNASTAQMYELYLTIVDLLVEIHAHAKDILERSQQKMLATESEKNPNLKFVNNPVLVKLSENELLQKELKKAKLNNWRLDNEYVVLLYNELIASDFYAEYMASETSDFKTDRDFVIDFFTEFVAPNDKLYDYLEDYRLTWVDDLPVVNTTIVKRLGKIKPNSPESTILPKLYKDEEDRQFAKDLLLRTARNDEEYEAEILGNTPNWDQDRIATLDKILIKMALCEFLRFSSIPVKVTINEYLELSKEYSTPKSSIFVNGVLDRLVKKYKKDNRLNKAGRGLIE
ncbi:MULTISPECIES: transcription antitermination factor NusB [Leeuwenhoekiella]|uniref:NusB antitermination factor n=1 Tax=Leeuwenhoekiella palythoae TaxID=573501 RepID=A0A1M5XYE7_9FLAO|nr:MULTISPECIES: transcription antitermination factor NusB [Leeuwenhoekiella]MEE3147930.1 transcription antitermination factor NusB [Bacteroidota bacterium]RXG30313.1 NusB antitermination factor [Leeuwenhoekiella palythoae]UBZ10462.1 transcription antitermination factor NusB [Leeuwenhoekiella palythoae]SHI04273.1 NusB antitermination factor [Leeuwenhoekiella palythoae]